MNSRMRRVAAMGALGVAAAGVIWQLRTHQPVDVTLHFDLGALELKLPARDGHPPERLTADKLRALSFRLQLDGHEAAEGRIRVAGKGIGLDARSAPMALRRGTYSLVVAADFVRYDGTPHQASRILPLAIEDTGELTVALRD